jgi:siroheme synthase-like protein
VSGVPILVEAAAVRVLVVGGGTVAARKAGALSEAGAQVRVVAPNISPVLHALAATGRVTLVERTYEPGDIGDVELVIAATSDRAVNAQVAAHAQAAHRLVNVADSPEDGSFATMAKHRSGSLVVGVSAGGVPGAAARIRDAIAQRFDSRYAHALADLAELRRSLLGRGDGQQWREFSREVIGDEFCSSVERASLDDQVAPWR